MRLGDQNLSISVIVPCYNTEAYLADAIKSILSQRYDELEVIIVDDGSTDRSAEIVKRFGDQVVYILQENKGAAAARNRGIEASSGTLLGFLDADDLWTENKLDKQLAFMGRNDNCVCVFGHVKQFLSPEIPGETRSGYDFVTESVPGRVPGTMLITREAFLDVGPFNEAQAMAEMVDWVARADEQGLRAHMLPDTLLMRRIHASNMGIIMRQSRQDYVKALKASLDRRRQPKDKIEE